MTDTTHLDELIMQTDVAFRGKLLKHFREMARSSDASAADYASKLRTLMDEAMQVEDAPG